MKKILFLLICSTSCMIFTGCNKVSSEAYNDLRDRYNNLSLEYDDLKNSYEVLQYDYDDIRKDPNFLLKEANKFTSIFLPAMGIDRNYTANYIGDSIQIIFDSQDSPREEFDYFKEKIIEGVDIMKLTCSVYDANKLYMKIIDEKGNSIFEYYFSNDDSIFSCSIGLDYLLELDK